MAGFSSAACFSTVTAMRTHHNRTGPGVPPAPLIDAEEISDDDSDEHAAAAGPTRPRLRPDACLAGFGQGETREVGVWHPSHLLLFCVNLPI